MRLVLAASLLAGTLYAQAPNPTQGGDAQTQVVTLDKTPLYRVTVVSRKTTAINYRHRSGSTDVDFRGTALMPQAKGKAEVESKAGYIEIKADMEDMSAATQYGPEYLTYVLWAISPEGRATNLGEVLLDGDRAKMKVSTELQSFGMIVTAEPYFAVMQPSDVVVMENFVRSDTKGKFEEIDANYELLQRGQYTFNVNKANVKSVMDPKVPLELVQARNAVQIARWAGADKYAGESFQKAVSQLKQAEDYHVRKQKKPSIMISREAVQTSEDSRAIALKRIEAERLAQERQASADREAKSRADAAEAARQRAMAEEQQKQEIAKRALAEERQKTEEARRAQAEAQRAQAEAERTLAEKAKAEAVVAQQAAMKATAEADAARKAAEVAQQGALAQQQLAQAEAEKSRLAAMEANRLREAAETDKERLRQQLLTQLNLILETRDSARGLIVNMADVLFDTAKHTLRPAAREKLARMSGIVLAHPGLKLEVEGHTDSVGGEEYNQRLSERRAQSVQEYLVSSGLSSGSVTAKGFGKTMPVASNDSVSGRQQNRRVELVVSGEAIGTKMSEIRGTVPARP